MWRQSKECVNCGEVRALHDERGRCRYQQPGWIAVTKVRRPALDHPVLARRGKETFLATRKEYPAVPGPGREVHWVVLNISRDGQPMNVSVVGVTHFRELRKGEGRRVYRSLLSNPA